VVVLRTRGREISGRSAGSGRRRRSWRRKGDPENAEWVRSGRLATHGVVTMLVYKC
jgi:hypothetical protein